MNTHVISASARWLDGINTFPRMIAGLLLSGAIAALSLWASGLPAIASRGLSALTLAIVIGLVIGNTAYPAVAARCDSGVGFAKARLLRAGIVLYGLRLTLQDIGQVGVAGVVIDVLMLSSTFLLAQWIGQKLLGMDRRATMLIGAGSSICGAAAVLATEPVVKGRAEDLAVAVATVVVFGTVGMFLYPALFHWNARLGWFNADPRQYGLYVGATVHEVAQAVAAAAAISSQSADVAVIAKMVRVMLLAPFLLILSVWLARGQRARDQGVTGGGQIVIPWFALGFVLMAVIHSLGVLPQGVVAAGITLDNVLLAMAMAALGLTTHLGAVRAAGAKPLLLAGLLFVWLLTAGWALSRWVPAWF
jgi:uncharacterized integral membrane protein (TIGR00698 family)